MFTLSGFLGMGEHCQAGESDHKTAFKEGRGINLIRIAQLTPMVILHATVISKHPCATCE
jgi:hypothetical protein